LGNIYLVKQKYMYRVMCTYILLYIVIAGGRQR
jgi:hypothetical protein